MRLVRTEYAVDGRVEHLGAPGAERLVRCVYEGDNVFEDGEVHYYEGARGEERHIGTLLPCGAERFYEAETGHLMRIAFPDGNEERYEGQAGEERLVRLVYTNGDADVYEGAPYEERLDRTEYADGRVAYYEGDPGSERKVMCCGRDENSVITVSVECLSNTTWANKARSVFGGLRTMADTSPISRARRTRSSSCRSSGWPRSALRPILLARAAGCAHQPTEWHRRAFRWRRAQRAAHVGGARGRPVVIYDEGELLMERLVAPALAEERCRSDSRRTS